MLSPWQVKALLFVENILRWLGERIGNARHSILVFARNNCPHSAPRLLYCQCLDIRCECGICGKYAEGNWVGGETKAAAVSRILREEKAP